MGSNKQNALNCGEDGGERLSGRANQRKERDAAGSWCRSNRLLSGVNFSCPIRDRITGIQTKTRRAPLAFLCAHAGACRLWRYVRPLRPLKYRVSCQCWQKSLRLQPASGIAPAGGSAEELISASWRSASGLVFCGRGEWIWRRVAARISAVWRPCTSPSNVTGKRGILQK